jgi:hypothetical protein
MFLSYAFRKVAANSGELLCWMHVESNKPSFVEYEFIEMHKYRAQFRVEKREL